jgi:hypothetical protein
MYLSSSVKQWRNDSQNFGIMTSITSIGGEQEALSGGALWMIDNGAFTNRFRLDRWQRRLEALSGFASTCIGVPVPDVVGDAGATLAQFWAYRHIPASLGYKIALVSQDGMTPDMMPWDYFDTLFVGGTNDHKRGKEAADLIDEAKRRGKWVHIGRVNSGFAILAHWPQADSYDGTTFSRHPSYMLSNIVNGLQMRTTAPYQRRLL